MKYVKSKKRVADHGEVFTPEWMVDDMMNMVADETQRIDARFLEPACGNGNFLVKILDRKLRSVRHKYLASSFDCLHYSLLAVMCTYGIELLLDNVIECRDNLLLCISKHLEDMATPDIIDASACVLQTNIIHGDALKMQDHNNEPICFAEWGYLGKGKYQRRDFRLQDLALSAEFSAEDSLFSQLSKKDLFVPVTSYQPCSLADIASQYSSEKTDSGS